MLRDLIEALWPIIVVLLTALSTIGSAALVQLMQKMGLDKEALNREALQSALMNAAYLAIARLGVVRPGASIIVPEEAVDYVLRSTPDAVKKFGLTPTQIADMIIPKIAAASLQGETAPRA